MRARRTLPRRFTLIDGDAGAVQGENAFHGNVVGNLADREGLGDSVAAALDDHAGEGLDALFGAFDDLEVDADGVAGAELGKVGTEVPVMDGGDCRMHMISLSYFLSPWNQGAPKIFFSSSVSSKERNRSGRFFRVNSRLALMRHFLMFS